MEFRVEGTKGRGGEEGIEKGKVQEKAKVQGQYKDSAKVELQKPLKCMQQFVDKDVRQSVWTAVCVCFCVYLYLCVFARECPVIQN